MTTGKIDYEAQILVALQEIKDALEKVAAALEAKQRTRTTTTGTTSGEKAANASVRKLTPGKVLHMIEERDNDVYEMIDQVKTFPSGDLLVTFEKLSKDEYRKLRSVMEELFNAKYSPKYRGFIIKQS